MKKIKGFIFSEKKLAGAIFSFLAIAAFAFIFGPNIYAQFARQDGSTGWGNGYGYGYGYGYGFDGGTVAGYRTDGNDLTTYDYGFGYGYRATGVTYDATNGYSVTPSTMSSLVQSGVMVPNGTSIASTTEVAFQDKVTMTVAAGTTITIPSGTTFTSATMGDFSYLAASPTVDTTALTDVNLAGSLSFGLPSLGLTISPAITIAVNVGADYNGRTLTIYRKDGSGSWVGGAANTQPTCVVSGGICTFTTNHLSSFAVGISTGGDGGNGGGGGSGGGGITTPACVNVTYGEYSGACFGGYQYRNVLTRTPVDCALTAAQLNSAHRACTVTTNPSGEQVVLPAIGFVGLEKSLVSKINQALSKRLAGRILLQVEGQGQAWYVNPLNGLKYFLGRPADAFNMMRQLGLGISEKDYTSFSKSKAPVRLGGRILLRVKSHGEAYYVNPLDNKLYYMGRPADAFALMRKFGLGINNTNLRQIGVGEVK